MLACAVQIYTANKIMLSLYRLILENKAVMINFADGNNNGSTRASKWLNVPIIAIIARLLCRELTIQNEYLRQESKF
jgi:hypothetical protein